MTIGTLFSYLVSGSKSIKLKIKWEIFSFNLTHLINIIDNTFIYNPQKTNITKNIYCHYFI